MSEPQPIERVSEKLKKEVAELNRTVKALVQAIKETENVTGEPLMPEGTYYGIEFTE